VGGQILGAAVGLDLDDARLAAPGLIVTDEACPEQTRCDDRGWSGQPRAIEDAQAGVLGK
jgi:hypothetical protein